MNMTCPNSVTELRLLALRDNALASNDAAQLRTHVQTCPACTAYLDMLATCGRALRHQRLPATLRSPHQQDRHWRAMRAQVGAGKARQRITYSNHMATRSTRSLGVALALLALFVGITQILSGGWGPLARPQTTIPILTANLSSATSVTIPAYLVPSYVSLNADTIIGVRFVRDQGGGYRSDAIARYTVASGTLDLLHTFSGQEQLAYAKVASDGRYVVWASATVAGSATATPMTLTSLDLQTMRLKNIATKADASQIYGDYSATVAQGNVVWQDVNATGNADLPARGALKLTDLATGTTTTLSSALVVSPGGVLSAPVFQESWPYVIFRAATSDTATDTAEEMMNITNGNATSLPKPPISNMSSLSAVYYALDGTSVLASWIAGDGSRTFVELDSADQVNQSAFDGVPWQMITTIAQPFIFPSALFQVNDSLIVFTGVLTSDTQTIVPLVWDRYRRRLIQLTTPAAGARTGVDLFSGLIAVETFVPDQPSTTLTLVYTSQVLP